MKQLISFILLLGIFITGCNPEMPPGYAGPDRQQPQGTSTAFSAPTNDGLVGTVSGGIYRLQTTETVEFDKIQKFSWYTPKDNLPVTNAQTHILLFEGDLLTLETIQKETSMSSISTYRAEGDWTKILMIDMGKPYYRYDRMYIQTGTTIEGSPQSINLELTMKNNNIVSCGFNSITFLKSSLGEKSN